MLKNRDYLLLINIFLTILMMIDVNEIKNKHISVMLEELVSSININNDKKNIIVDMTLWMWWHASEIIKKMNDWDIFIWFDADIKNLELANIRLNEINIDQKIEIILINSNFKNLKDELFKRWINSITWIYFDLWLSSLHIDEAERWFSFMKEWPLDMRLDKSKWKTASDIVNWYTKDELRKIFIEYWEEPWANKFSSKIIEKRKNEKFRTTSDLAEILPDNIKVKSRVFQALRIEVNNELESIKIAINDAIKLLEKDWIIFVISFHSLEDRITKQILKRETRDCICDDIICSCKHKKSIKLLNKKPIIPSEDEINKNPRSRSAKARCAKKII